MMNQTILDFDALMERLGVGFAPRESHGEIVNIPDWTVAQCLKALEIVETEILPPGKSVLIKKHPTRWLYGAIICQLWPLGVWIAQHDGSVVKVEAPTVGENSTFVFETEEKDENLFIRYRIPSSDNVRRDYAINFTNLKEVVLPPLPEGKNLFFETLGSSAVPVGMCLVYGPKAKSIWIAEPNEQQFMCAVTNCEAFGIGHVYPVQERGQSV